MDSLFFVVCLVGMLKYPEHLEIGFHIYVERRIFLRKMRLLYIHISFVLS